MLEVIGYEAGRNTNPIEYGCAAIRCEKGVYNSLLSYTKASPMKEEEYQRLAKKGSVCPTEVPIPIEKDGPYFVLNIRSNLAKRKPYHIENDWGKVLYGVVAIGIGENRTYYIFESFDKLKSYLSNLNMGKFILMEDNGL